MSHSFTNRKRASSPPGEASANPFVTCCAHTDTSAHGQIEKILHLTAAAEGLLQYADELQRDDAPQPSTVHPDDSQACCGWFEADEKVRSIATTEAVGELVGVLFRSSPSTEAFHAPVAYGVSALEDVLWTTGQAVCAEGVAVDDTEIRTYACTFERRFV